MSIGASTARISLNPFESHMTSGEAVVSSTSHDWISAGAGAVAYGPELQPIDRGRLTVASNHHTMYVVIGEACFHEWIGQLSSQRRLKWFSTQAAYDTRMGLCSHIQVERTQTAATRTARLATIIATGRKALPPEIQRTVT